MQLAELLEHEGLDPDELMDWARRRADGLVAGLVSEADSSEPDPLVGLLDSGSSVDIASVAVRQSESEPESGARHPDGRRRRKPSSPQPLSAAELPPPPEQPRLADGEPEPILETFNTGPIDLGSPEAAALIAETSTREPEPAEDELEELEFDELVELDDEELELLEEVDDADADSPPPPPPPSGGPPPLEAEAPVRSGDTATDLPTPALEAEAEAEAEEPVQTGDTAVHATIDAALDDALDDPPVQTGDTAAHPVVDEALDAEDPRNQADAASESAGDDDMFDLSFDDD